MLKNISLFLAALMIFQWPLQAMAAGKSLAIVEVHDGSSTKDLSLLRQKIELKLSQSGEEILPADQIIKALNPIKLSSYTPAQTTMADTLFEDAEKQWLNVNLAGSLATITKAIEALKKNPGIQGNLFKAWILKGQIELELKQSANTIASFEEAIKTNLDAKELDPYFYAPKIQKLYEKIYTGLLKKTQTAQLKVSVSGASEAPIYVNGIRRGVGPLLNIKICRDQTQSISAGDSLKNIQTQAMGSEQTLKIVASKSPQRINTPRQLTGLKNSPRLLEDAISLGQSVAANRVLLLELKELNYINRLQVTAIDTTSQMATPVKQIEIVDLVDDADQAVNAVKTYVTHLSRTSFTQNSSEGAPVLVGRAKKKTPKGLLFGLIGVVVVGAGVGAALGLGGGGGSSASNNSAVDVSGPPPANP